MNSFLLSSGRSPSAVGSEADLVNGLLRFQAEPGQYIRLVRAAEDSGEEVSVWRKKKDLLIKVDDEVQAIIEDFYSTEGEGGLAIEGEVLIAYDQIEADASNAPDENLVWWGEASTVDMVPPVVIAPVVVEPVSEPVTPVADVEPVAPVQAEPKEDSDEGGWIADNAWLIAGGVLAVAGAAYLLTREEEDESASLKISAFAGPFFSDSTVNVYNGSGKQIGTGVLNASTGQVSFDLGDYRGLVIVEVVDANGDDADYTSEATGLETDLDTSLRAIGEVTGSGRLSLSVTPLTEMAARAANLPDDLSELADSPLTSDVLAVNDQIAALFGLNNILSKVTTVLDEKYNSENGTSAAELYGDILAILSGMEENLGGLDASLTALLNEISIIDGVATLTPAGGLLLQQAQIQYENNGSGAALSGQTVIEDMPLASQFPEVVNLAELNADQSLSMDINAVSAGDVLVVTLGDQTFDVTVTEDMLDDAGTTATINFPASALFQLDDGVQTLQLNVNGVDRQNTQLTLDLTRPSLTDYSLEKSTLLVGETSTITLVFSEAVTNFSADDVFAYEGSFANFETTDGGVTWTGVFTPEGDTEASGLNLNLSENFTDLAGNGPGYSLGLGIPVLIDTLAPAVPDAYLENDRGSSDTDGVTKQGTIIFGTPTEDGLTYKYSLDGGDSWTPTTLDYVNLAAGIYPQGDIQVVAIDENGNESEPYTHPIELVIDNVAPKTPGLLLTTDTGVSDTDQISSQAQLTVTDVEDGALVQYSLDGESNWSNSFDAVEGANTVYVRQTDVAGNVSEVSEAFTFTLDSVTPETLVLGLSSDSGSSNSDLISYKNGLKITGAEPGTTLEYRVYDGTQWSDWSASFEAIEGENTLQVRQTDIAGNVSEISDTLTFVWDSSAPGAPVLSLSKDSGSSNSDLLTNDATLTLAGVEQGATVQYSLDGESNWSDSFEAVEGENTVYVRQTDVAGNTGEAGSAFTFTLDTEAPEVDQIPTELTYFATKQTQTEAPNDTSDENPRVAEIGSNGDYVVVWESLDDGGDKSLFVQRFNAEGLTLGDQIKLEALGNTDGDDTQASVIAIGSDGAFAVTWVGVDSEGDDSVFVQAFDATGAVSGVTVQLESANASGFDSRPSISEVGSLGAYVVSWSGSDGNGFSQLYVQAFNTDGSTKGSTIDVGSLMDESIYAGWVDVAAIGSEGDYLLVWEGWVAANSDYSIFVQAFNADGSLKGSVTKLDALENQTGSDRSASVVSIGTEGDYALCWEATDSDGDFSIFSQAFNVDGTPKAAMVQLEGVGNPTGYDAAATLIALGAEGEYVIAWHGMDGNNQFSIFVQIFNADGTVKGDTLLLQSSEELIRFNTNPQMVAVGTDGAFVVVWTAFDEEYDTSTYVQTFNADGSRNGSPVLLEPEGVANGGDYSPYVAALGDEGSFVVTWYGADSDGDNSIFSQIFLPQVVTNDALQTAFVNPDVDRWAFSLDGGDNWTEGTGTEFSLEEGIYSAGSVVVRYFDLAGNYTEVSNGAEIVIDITAPAAPTLTLEADTGEFDNDDVTSNGKLVFTGADDNLTYKYSLDAGSSWDNTDQGFIELTEGVYSAESIQVIAIDKAGNESEAAVYQNALTIDQTDPEEAIFTLAEDTGESDSDYVTRNNTLNITLAEDTVSWRYSLDEGDSWEDGTGTSLTLEEGEYSEDEIRIIQTDLAGNENSTSLGEDVTVDTTAPTITLTAVELGIIVPAGDSTSIDLSSNEYGTAYFVNSAVEVTSLNDILEAADDQWNAVDITSLNTGFDLDTTGLAAGDYVAYAVDQAGNVSTASSSVEVTAVVDNTAPSVTLYSGEGGGTIAAGDTTSLDVLSNEVGTVYFVDSSLTVNSVEDITGAQDSQWNSVAITAANTSYDLDTSGLASGNYVAYAVDESGNLSAASSNQVTVQAAASADPSIVVFDLVNGVSSDHSGRTFQSDVSYDIYIRINSDSSALETTPGSGAAAGATFGVWSGGEYLGSDDTIYLVGDDGTPVLANKHLSMNPGTSFTTSNTAIMWFGTGGGVGSLRAVLISNGSLLNSIGSIDGFDATQLWNGTWSGAQLPAYGYQLVVSATILSTQGLV